LEDLGLGTGCRCLYLRHTLCLEETDSSGLFLIKELPKWLQGFLKLAMCRILFLRLLSLATSISAFLRIWTFHPKALDNTQHPSIVATKQTAKVATKLQAENVNSAPKQLQTKI
jgi:hypothetical protein